MKEHPGTFTAGILFVIVGMAYLLEAFDVWTVRIDRLWPVGIIAIGAAILLGGGAFGEHDDDEDVLG